MSGLLVLADQTDDVTKEHKEAFKVSVKSEFQQQQQRKGKIFWEILILSVCLFTACTDKLFNKKILLH